MKSVQLHTSSSPPYVNDYTRSPNTSTVGVNARSPTFASTLRAASPTCATACAGPSRPPRRNINCARISPLSADLLMDGVAQPFSVLAQFMTLYCRTTFVTFICPSSSRPLLSTFAFTHTLQHAFRACTHHSAAPYKTFACAVSAMPSSGTRRVQHISCSVHPSLTHVTYCTSSYDPPPAVVLYE